MSKGLMRDVNKANKRLLKIERAVKREGFKIIAGLDEAGRGPLAGPVVACAVILKEYSFPVEIRDSKQLTALARVKAYEEILKRAYVGIGIVDKTVIDKINILRASLLAMEQAVLNLKISPDCLLIDGPYRINDSVKNISLVKGDNLSLSIACASIMAKVARDRIMFKLDSLYPQYGFKSNKGYGTKTHLEAIEKFGPSPVHRLSFFPFARKNNKKNYLAEELEQTLF